MRFLIDQSLPLRAAAELRTRGHDAVHAREAGLSTAPDEDILERCRRESRIVVSPDADFPTLIVLARASSPSVIRIISQGLSAAEVAEIVADVAPSHEAALKGGALVTVRHHLVAVRALPIEPREERP